MLQEIDRWLARCHEIFERADGILNAGQGGSAAARSPEAKQLLEKLAELSKAAQNASIKLKRTATK